MSLDLKVFEVLSQYRLSLIDDYRKEYHGHINHERKEIYINRKAQERDKYYCMSQLLHEAYMKMNGLEKGVDEE